MKTKYSSILGLMLVVPINFGRGYYTNLCGSGTAATAYTCDKGCNPSTGSCTTTGDGAVRYVCQGNWNQCLENESGWVNGVSLGDPGCEKTVQLSIYSQKCRNDDGTWDATCRLLGYMVWYSGDCRPGVAGYATGIPLAPTATKTPTTPQPSSKFSTPIPSKVATPTVAKLISPTVIKPKAVCNKVCSVDSDCGTGLYCESKLCRNRDCPTDKTCFCSTVLPTNKPEVAGTTTPETGMPVWLLSLGILGLGYMGLKVLRIGKMIWS